MENVKRKIKRTTLFLYLTVGLAVINSLWFHIITTDNAHIIFSSYFFVEAAILLLLILLGLENKWTRLIIGLLTLAESILFLNDKPISPDELLMIIIFGIRLYVIILLYSKQIREYYTQSN